MLNHARTLLLNVKPLAVQRCSFPGEELLDPTYVPVVLPTYLQTLYRNFYGTTPDRWMRNYRTRQLMAVVHSTPLVELVQALDPRITYRFDDDPYTDHTLFQPQRNQTSGTVLDKIQFSGKPSSPDTTGRMLSRFEVDVVSNEAISVQRMTKPFSKVVFDLALGASGWSERFPLAGSGYKFAVNTINPGAGWVVEIVNRPQRDLSDLVSTVETIGEPVLDELFGFDHAEPYKTFKNLWWTAKELPLRLGSIVTAMIYRTQERRSHHG